MFNAKFSYYKLAAAASTGLLVLSAAGTANAAVNNFSTLSTAVTTSIGSVPGLLSAIAYLFGVILVILGIIKIKEHVEKPDQTPLKEGFIRLIIGGALFALPLLLDVAKETVSAQQAGNAVAVGVVKKANFNAID